MDWTDCPIVEQVAGRMSGAPVLRGTRVRPQDILANAHLGAEWIAEAHSLSIHDVRELLAFHDAHLDELPLEYITPEEIEALRVDDIDWSGCSLVERSPSRLSGSPVIRRTPVRVIDLLTNRSEGVDGLTFSYGVPPETVRSVLAYYDEHSRLLAPAL